MFFLSVSPFHDRFSFFVFVLLNWWLASMAFSMRYSRMLEESSFANRRADYFWLLLQSAAMLLVSIFLFIFDQDPSGLFLLTLSHPKPPHPFISTSVEMLCTPYNCTYTHSHSKATFWFTASYCLVSSHWWLWSFFSQALSPLINIPFLSASLAFVPIYVWSRRHPDTPISLFGIINITAPYLPIALVAFSWVLNGTWSAVVGDLAGCVVGHVAWFLRDVWAREMVGGRSVLTDSPQAL